MDARKTPVVFYQSASGAEPVRDWLKELSRADRHSAGQDLMRLQYRWPVGMPLCRALGDGLWEVRTTLPSRRIARMLFCFSGGDLYILHGFVKKTQKTPEQDLAMARKRMKEIG
jgi:phage-related protein